MHRTVVQIPMYDDKVGLLFGNHRRRSDAIGIHQGDFAEWSALSWKALINSLMINLYQRIQHIDTCLILLSNKVAQVE